jgi:biopolymer transport protein ExbB/TolQ
MKLPTLLLLLLIMVTAFFAAMNWGVFVQPIELSFGVVSAQLPFGLIMLGLLTIAILASILFAMYVQARALLETRRHVRDLEACRNLVEKAEASRFVELRQAFEAAIERQELRHKAFEEEIHAAITKHAAESRAHLDESVNSLAAYIGELEDRLERGSRT